MGLKMELEILDLTSAGVCNKDFVEGTCTFSLNYILF